MAKIKRNTELIYNGETAYMERDREDGTALIRIGTMFEDVDTCDLKLAVKGRSGISNKPKVLNDKEKTEKQKLDEFYSRIALRMPYNCENCNQPLQAFNKFAKRSCAAHILPKSLFPSISTNEDNILFMGAGFLGGCHCHDTFDSDANTRSKMKVFPIALERFEKLKQYLTNKEIIKANTYLSIEYGK